MKTEPGDTPLASWSHTPESIPQGGLETKRAASADELKAIAGVLDLLALEALTVEYRIRNAGGGVYRLTGRLKAQAVQACVVTLEPVHGDIDETFEVEFQPEERTRKPVAAADDEGEDLSADFESEIDKEPITGGRMEVGRVVFETLASAIDPYPRKAGAAFDWKAPEADKAGTVSPFAALAKLKNKP